MLYCFIMCRIKIKFSYSYLILSYNLFKDFKYSLNEYPLNVEHEDFPTLHWI